MLVRAVDNVIRHKKSDKPDACFFYRLRQNFPVCVRSGVGKVVNGVADDHEDSAARMFNHRCAGNTA